MRWQLPFTADPSRIKAAIRGMPIVPPTPAADAPTRGEPRRGPRGMISPYAQRISSLAAALSPIRGRKAMLLFTYGLASNRPAAIQVSDDVYIRPHSSFEDD